MRDLLKNRFCLLLIPLLFLSSCISTYDLMESYPSDIARFSVSGLNGNYSNSGDDEYNDLWSTLSNFKTSKKDTVVVPKDAMINLHFENDQRLIMTAYEDKKIVKQTIVKGKLMGDYFSVRRKLFLIPIPLFFIHQEAKVIFGQGQRDNLIVKYGKENGAWILIFAGGSGGGFNKNEYARLD